VRALDQLPRLLILAAFVRVMLTPSWTTVAALGLVALAVVSMEAVGGLLEARSERVEAMRKELASRTAKLSVAQEQYARLGERLSKAEKDASAALEGVAEVRQRVQAGHRKPGL
jgi:septal ring factor EnvC (AmiA/AmiB activator)